MPWPSKASIRRERVASKVQGTSEVLTRWAKSGKYNQAVRGKGQKSTASGCSENRYGDVDCSALQWTIGADHSGIGACYSGSGQGTNSVDTFETRTTHARRPYEWSVRQCFFAKG